MMPTYVALPSEYRDACRVASVVAAIPIAVHGQKPGSVYAVTAIEPSSSLSAPVFVAAEVSREANGSWFADETSDPTDLAGALGDMATLADLL